MPMSVPSRLFEPFTLNGTALRNRVVMAPMSRYMSPGGVPHAGVVDYYRRRAAGGTGLIITEGSWVPHAGASNDDNVPDLFGDAALAGWRQVIEAVHAEGGRIFPQLWHVGLIVPVNKSIDDLDPGYFQRAVSPSGLLAPGEPRGEPMTTQDIEAVIAAFGQAAATSKALGFDGINIHGAHGYLIDQFLWSRSNLRSDGYGGGLAARGRFGVELVRACRAAVGPDFPIMLRVSQWKQQDYGAKLAETPAELEQMLAPLAEAGVDCFDCSQRRFWEPEFPGDPRNLAGWAKALTGKASMTVGSIGLDTDVVKSMTEGAPAGISSLDRMFAMLDDGQFDLVAIGRGMLSDPDWSNKVASGREAELEPYRFEHLASLA